MLYVFIFVAFVLGAAVGWAACASRHKECKINIGELLTDAFDLGVAVATRHNEEQNINKDKVSS